MNRKNRTWARLGVALVAVVAGWTALSETVTTRYGTSTYARHVPQAKSKVAAILYAVTQDAHDVARCPVARLNERGYAVVTLDCTKLAGRQDEARAAAIKAVKRALADDARIASDKIGVVLDLVQPGWDRDEANWMALADAYDRKGWNADPAKVAQTAPFTVMAWNLESNSQTTNEVASLVRLLNDLKPDVVLVSEAYGKQPQLLAELGAGWYGKTFSMNLAILSRWPIVRTETPYEAPWNYLDPTGPFNFGLAELMVEGLRIRACPLWLNWETGVPRFSNPRNEELAGILGAIRGPLADADEVPLLLGGDFNAYVEPHEPMMAKAGFIDTYRLFHPDLDGTNTWTWAPHDGSRHLFLDYIFVKGAKLRPVASETFHAPWHRPFTYRGRAYDSFPSDHGFVLTTFERDLPPPAGAAEVAAIVNGTHGYTPKDYVVPPEREVRERLEWFKDQKLALMMHFGMYSQMGIVESWALSDADAHWSRFQLDWVADGEAFKRQYWNLWKSFNPTRLQPQKWARLAKDNGFKYLIFTTKHHDGFCLFDTKYTDFKVTNPACPFAAVPRADIVRNVFDAFRAEGLGIAAYFSKPDWHSEDFWEDHGLGRTVSRMPTYDVKAKPEKWARFREFTKNQIVELVRDYGPLDAIWLDGGQVQRRTGLDIGIEDIIAEARKFKPDLISVDRTAGGPCENVITPEQTVPPEPLAVPWESCITMGTGFSYRYDDEYKSPRELVHLLLDIVAKGGNLALNVAPGPDGRLPEPAIERMEALGAWLKANGEGIYATRPAAPYASGQWRFTEKAGAVYAFHLWKPGRRNDNGLTIPAAAPQQVTKVVHLATGRALDFTCTANGLELRLPELLRHDPYAEGFRLERQ